MSVIHWRGHTPLPRRRIALRRAVKRAQRNRLVVTSTNGGVHAPTSYHYLLRAVDVGGALDDMERFQREEYFRSERQRKKTGKSLYAELFGPDNNYAISRGMPTRLVEGAPLETLHDNHVHLAR